MGVRSSTANPARGGGYAACELQSMAKLSKRIQERQVELLQEWEQVLAQPRSRLQTRHLQEMMAAYEQAFPFWRALKQRVVRLPLSQDAEVLSGINLEEWLGDFTTVERMSIDAVMKAGPAVMATALAGPAVTLLLQEGGTVDFRTAITALGNAFNTLRLRVHAPEEEAAARDARSTAVTHFTDGPSREGRAAGSEEERKTRRQDDSDSAGDAPAFREDAAFEDDDDAASSVSQCAPCAPLTVQPLYYGTRGELRSALWWVEAIAEWVRYYAYLPDVVHDPSLR